jgi:formate C-acetyltransferase
MFQNLVVGGQTPDGRDATNELSYICIEATSNLALPQPSFSARYHAGSPQEFLEKCCGPIKRGIGFPAIYNDEVIIPSLLNRGISREDAYDYCVVGCPEPSVHGKWAYRCNGGPFVNLPKIFELALNNGTDVKTGYQLLPGKGSLTTFRSFQDVIDAWNTQRDYYLGLHVLCDHINDKVLEELLPDPFASALVADCIGRGKSIIEGGAIYDLVGGQTLGLANLANSLAAIKKLVFEDGAITGGQLAHALETDFEDEETKPRGEEIRQMLLSAPKYGNDDDYVDLLAKQVFLEYLQKYAKYKNARYGRGPIGGTFSPSTSTVSANVPFGKKVGATPDGRRDGEELADGASPQYGTDVEGPTAVIKSVGKLDNVLVSGGNLLNLKFNPSVFEGDAGTRNLAAFIKTFCQLKGFHVQFNVISSDVLRDAQIHPERHRNLLVRVAAYVAFFTSLDKEIQDAIIKRTEHSAMQ